jgi:hypothetical protein
MGARLASYFDQAGSIGGIQAKMKLALLTKMASPKAAEVDDTPDQIAAFEAALSSIKQEFGR